jgi:metal-responsive CopG/Arc/MetJ family transcriptional regulator
MGQVTIYLDAETEKKMNQIVKKNKVSKSQWVSELIKEKIADSRPDNIINLAGAWKDFPSIDEIRAQTRKDAKREPL